MENNRKIIHILILTHYITECWYIERMREFVHPKRIQVLNISNAPVIKFTFTATINHHFNVHVHVACLSYYVWNLNTNKPKTTTHNARTCLVSLLRSPLSVPRPYSVDLNIIFLSGRKNVEHPLSKTEML